MVAHRKTSKVHDATEHAPLVIATVVTNRVITSINQDTLIEHDFISTTVTTPIPSTGIAPHATSDSGKAIVTEVVLNQPGYADLDWLPITAKDESMIPARWKYEPYLQDDARWMSAMLLLATMIGVGILVVWVCTLVKYVMFSS
jgi:hypothetical protein